MEIINAADGRIVQRSRNLRGIRDYAGKHLIDRISVRRMPDGGGLLSIDFNNGCAFSTVFADYTVLCGWVNRWRNVRGAPLHINGHAAGFVGPHNPE